MAIVDRFVRFSFLKMNWRPSRWGWDGKTWILRWALGPISSPCSYSWGSFTGRSQVERGMLRKWQRPRPISERGAERQTDRGIEGWQKTRAESGPGAEPTRPPVDCSPGAKCSVKGHSQWPGQDDPLCLSLAASLWSPLPLGVDTDQQVIDRHKPWETVLGDLVLILYHLP